MELWAEVCAGHMLSSAVGLKPARFVSWICYMHRITVQLRWPERGLGPENAVHTERRSCDGQSMV